MIGIDSNVLVRFLVQDDPDQAKRATKALRKLSSEQPGYLTTIVLVETFWVLTRAYKLAAPDVLSALSDVVHADSVVVQDAKQVARALTLATQGADFPDALIASTCLANGCTSILSFDRRAAKVLGFKAP